MKINKVIILIVLSMALWYMTVLLQAFVDLVIFQNTPTFLGTQCNATGYPIAVCLEPNNSAATYLISFANICTIFAVLNYLPKLVRKLK